jgi:hypothetical protein
MKSILGIVGVALLTVGCGGGEQTVQASVPATETSAAAPGATATSAPVAAARTHNANRAVAGGVKKAAPRAAAAEPVEYREVTLPEGTVLPLTLESSMGSDTSHVEDAIRGSLRESVAVNGRRVLPAGTILSGNVTDVEQPGRVKGRARIAFRFTTLRHDAERYDIQTDAIERIGEATKGEDATKIGVGAGAGAALGALLGGGKGAAKGAVIGGAAGTGAVLATRGKDVRLESGAEVDARLASPLTVRVRIAQ